ncbi:MAG TPA: hypothetical protein V6D08_03550 [Candidatus Obscuribacterales bacterium]
MRRLDFYGSPIVSGSLEMNATRPPAMAAIKSQRTTAGYDSLHM